MLTLLTVLVCSVVIGSGVCGQGALYWNTQALDTLNEELGRQEPIKNQAKNVIVFIGDGMGVTTVTAARILKGQLNGDPGEEYFLNWERFPNIALSKTYNTDIQVADSAASATAFYCGVKTYGGAIGLDDRGERSNCSASLDSHVASVLKEANDVGKATGIVTTTRVTHATPASTYAHTPERDWESNNDLSPEAVANGCSDVASQFIEHDEIQVVLGGGRREFYTVNQTDVEYPDSVGKRTDGRDLVQEWSAAHPNNAEYVWKKDQLDNVDPESTKYLLGLFEPSHMHYESDRLEDIAGEPSIADMTEKAIQILQKEPNGFFLAVEGGRIDHAHHDCIAYKALHDTVAMEAAVQKAIDMTNSNETLIIVTADHSHTLTFAGEPKKGHDILGKLENQRTDDFLPYATLGYANGPSGSLTSQSFLEYGHRRNLTGVETNSKDFVNEALIPRYIETHAGEDVAIYASGPFAHLFSSVHEQHYIAHVIRYAACLGERRKFCTDAVEPDPCDAHFIQVNFVLICVVALAVILCKPLIV